MDMYFFCSFRACALGTFWIVPIVAREVPRRSNVDEALRQMRSETTQEQQVQVAGGHGRRVVVGEQQQLTSYGASITVGIPSMCDGRGGLQLNFYGERTTVGVPVVYNTAVQKHPKSHAVET